MKVSFCRVAIDEKVQADQCEKRDKDHVNSAWPNANAGSMCVCLCLYNDNYIGNVESSVLTLAAADMSQLTVSLASLMSLPSAIAPSVPSFMLLNNCDNWLLVSGLAVSRRLYREARE